MLCSVLDYNDLLNIIVTIQGSYGHRGFDVWQRGVISLMRRLGLISYLLPSSASASCSPSTSSCGLSPAQFLSQSDQARGPIWRQATRWSLATIELLPWEPRASVCPGSLPLSTSGLVSLFPSWLSVWSAALTPAWKELYPPLRLQL